MSASNRNLRQPGGGEWAPLILIAAAAALWLICVTGANAAAGVAGAPTIALNPLRLVRGLIDGTATVELAHAIGAGVAIALAAGGAVAVAAAVSRRRARRPGAGVAHAVGHMATAGQVRSMSRRAAAAAASRMGLDLPDGAEPGVLIGRDLRTGQPVYADYETLLVQLWAARRGKTSTQVLPQILSAPGGVVTSSNKRDVVDDSLAARQRLGTCWVFDPQRIYSSDEPDWFFDPLDYIRRRPRDEWDAAATALASLLRDDAGMTGGERDMFSEGGQTLVAGMLLAACCAGLPITVVVDWAGNEADRTPVDLLHEHGWPRKAAALAARYDLTDRTRSGVFGNAQQMVACLEHEVPGRWVTPAAGKRRFDADAFIAESQAGGRPTMYVLSKEGPTSASALTLILTVTLMDAAEEYGERCDGGRLAVPLIVPLDEAANCVRWGQLANKYSHYGSRSIIITTILQSFTQAKRIWGEDSTRDMLTNGCLVYGGGIKDRGFLEELSAFVGEHEERRLSRSRGRAQDSVSESIGEKRTLTVAELQALPFGVMLVVPQKAPPMLVEAVPWWKRRFTGAVAEALAEKG